MSIPRRAGGLPIIRPRSQLGWTHDMARKKSTSTSEFTFFDVLYDDGSRRSNRRVPTALLGGLDGDDAAREAIEAQDQEIAKRSGQLPATIKSVTRSAGR
jgi:hypothetical protein